MASEGVQSTHECNSQLITLCQLLPLLNRWPSLDFQLGMRFEVRLNFFIGGYKHNIMRMTTCCINGKSSYRTQTVAMINIFEQSSFPIVKDKWREGEGFILSVFINSLAAISLVPSQNQIIIIMSKQNKRLLGNHHQGPTLDHYYKDQPQNRLYSPPAIESQGYSTNVSFPHVSVGNEYRGQMQVDDDNSNAIDFLGLEKFKMAAIERESLADPNASNTIPFEKIALPHDNDETKKHATMVHQAIKKQVEKPVPRTASKEKRKPPSEDSLPQTVNVAIPTQLTTNMNIHRLPAIVPTPSESILLSPPLRARFRRMLENHQLFKIGQNHSRLLFFLKKIDGTIEYLNNHRRRFSFFTDIRINFYEANKTELTKQHLQQLLFLDQGLYDVQWEYYQKGKKYDLHLKMPVFKSQDERVAQIRKKIVQYLLNVQERWLHEKGQEQTDQIGWAAGFQPNDHDIPLVPLPPHPTAKTAQIGQLSEKQVDSIANAHLRNYVQTVKDNDNLTVRSEDVSSRIFGKKPASTSNFEASLYRLIKERQKKAAEEEEKKGPLLNRPPEKSVLSNVCQDILTICMSKGVTNMFRQTLIETLNKRLSTVPSEAILRSLEWILGEKEVGYLRETTLASKSIVVQVDRTKFSKMMDAIKATK